MSRTDRAPRAVRIIGGQWKRTPLAVAQVEGLRPTPDRVRESLFNWLTHFAGGPLDGLEVLDLFAGTGALGFESASRGAARVVLVEAETQAVAALRAAKDRLQATQIEIRQGDARAAIQGLRSAEKGFDIIFLDPPFRAGWIERIVEPTLPLLRAGGLIYIEAEMPLGPEQANGWGLELLRADKAGQVFYHLLRRTRGNNPGENGAC